jgi:glycosyltransferase involved in cell wall biosynthesis
MLTIIIPVYNDIEGLWKTLFSLTNITYPFEVYIINDGSEEIEQYNQIVNYFNITFFPAYIIHIKNQGPGIARQVGLDASNGEYILFIDCGDIIINGSKIREMINNELQIKNHLAFGEFNILMEHSKNNFHHNGTASLVGKIFKRYYIDYYNIRFNPECSYYFEDVGFATIFAILMQNKNFDFIHWDIPIMVATFNKNSLTKKNNADTFYKSYICKSKNIFFALSHSSKYNIDPSIILKSKYEYLIDTYIDYLIIKERHPAYIDVMIENCKYFYKNLNINTFEPQLLLDLYNSIFRLRGCDPKIFTFMEFLLFLENLK